MNKEFWVVYGLEDGGIRWRGSGVVGEAAQQRLEDGLGVMVVPQPAITGASLDLSVIKAFKQMQVDAEAEAERLKYITAGYGQAMTYMAKNAEALGYLANNAYPTPFLTAEAASTGTTVAALALIVRDAAIAWQAAGAAIEAARMGAKAAISSATNLAEIATAAAVDWDNL